MGGAEGTDVIPFLFKHRSFKVFHETERFELLTTISKF